MIRFTSLLRDFKKELQAENMDSPEYIGITKKAAQELRGELAQIARFNDEETTLSENEMLLFGIKIIAPKGFRWK